jgi:hypothetical protein
MESQLTERQLAYIHSLAKDRKGLNHDQLKAELGFSLNELSNQEASELIKWLSGQRPDITDLKEKYGGKGTDMGITDEISDEERESIRPIMTALEKNGIDVNLLKHRDARDLRAAMQSTDSLFLKGVMDSIKKGQYFSGDPNSSHSVTKVAESAQAVKREGTAKAPSRFSISDIDIDMAVALYEKFEEAKRRLATPSDIQIYNGNRKFYKKAFWRKVSTAFYVEDRILSVETFQIGNETICRAIVEATWNGRSITDIGVYSSKEFTGKRVFNIPDLESSAVTRAKNRAISDVVGGGEVSAEEVQQ